MTHLIGKLKRRLKPQPETPVTEPLTELQKIDAARERRVAAREPIDYSYTIFWMKQARLWEADRRSAVAQRLEKLLKSPVFQANPYDRNYTLDGVEGAHSGASLKALAKVLAALQAAP